MSEVGKPDEFDKLGGIDGMNKSCFKKIMNIFSILQKTITKAIDKPIFLCYNSQA